MTQPYTHRHTRTGIHTHTHRLTHTQAHTQSHTQRNTGSPLHRAAVYTLIHKQCGRERQSSISLMRTGVSGIKYCDVYVLIIHTRVVRESVEREKE